MVADELTRALIEETTLEDISESYRPVVDIIGIEKFIELILIIFREPDTSNLPRKRSQPTMPMPMMQSSSSPRKA